ncbi:Transglycosylase SLT domain-containing protein [Mycolicibacterium rutilum]|uniref:Transglycosylase SLT domain-containing protein n=1 Tax=Mycolicibacterium rutilum TaxID=370526 RepID=A0A1H6KLA1_MYCRU|nr:lytic transglycosylase domain-containing protein [Mycolicibacterium rutilum]SEH74500.1 Transglycosylase SLT domain-containing protein [Mycolicibacterium rutilum]
MSVIAAIRRAAPVVAVAAFALTGCTTPAEPPPSTTAAPPSTSAPAPTPAPARRELASDPVQIADDLVADERTLRDPSAPDDVLVAAAHRQQLAYRTLGRNADWERVARPRIPPQLAAIYDRNISARQHLTALSEGTAQDTLPAWRIVPPPPADELLAYYREAEAASGVSWSHLAAINMIETVFGRVAGVSTAGAQGPMQFLPSTFAAYGEGGDIHSPRDSIMAAGRYLAANGFAADPDRALFRYNNSTDYVQAVNDYAAVLADDPAAFAGYHRWQVYYKTTAGDVLLPVGYFAQTRIPVAEYLSSQPSPPPR